MTKQMDSVHSMKLRIDAPDVGMTTLMRLNNLSLPGSITLAGYKLSLHGGAIYLLS